MNLAPTGGDPLGSLLFANFNQDSSSIAVGSCDGYILYSLQNPDVLDQVYLSAGTDTCIVERLFSSSLVALVSLSSPRKLKVTHFKRGTEICNYSYPNTIMSVRLNRERLAVVLEESIYIHNIQNMKVIHTIRDTPPNSLGICALSLGKDDNYLAYPGKGEAGQLQIFDTVNVVAHLTINAHTTPLAAIAFSADSKVVATASVKGTVIRLFSTQSGAKMMEFRRGVKRCVTIYSLAFSPDGQYLCASSNTETVHIFKLETTRERPSPTAEGGDSDRPEDRGQDQSWMSFLGSVVVAPAKFMPNQLAQVADSLNQTRAFATAKLPVAGYKNVCAVSCATEHSPPRVMVASGDGRLYIYTINSSDGGDCDLFKQHVIRPSTAEPEPTPDSGAGGGAGGLANMSCHESIGSGGSGGYESTSAPTLSGYAAAAAAGVTPMVSSQPAAASSQAGLVMDDEEIPVDF